MSVEATGTMPMNELLSLQIRPLAGALLIAALCGAAAVSPGRAAEAGATGRRRG